MLDIIFYEAFEEEKQMLKKYLPSNVTAEFTDQTIQESNDNAPKANVVCIRTQSKIPLGWAEAIDGVFSRSQGFDHLIAFLKQSSARVPCGYLPGYCAQAVSEQALLCMFALLRRFKKQLKQFEYFDRDGLTGVQAAGKNALVVGVGYIGSQLCANLSKLGLNVKGVDPEKKHKEIDYVDLARGFNWADIIFCAADLNETTEGLLDYSAFKNISQKPILINVSRGEITPVEDMLRLMNERKINGLAMDVYPDEGYLAETLRSGPTAGDKPIQDLLALKGRDDVILTPHNAFNTQESLEEKSSQTVDAIMNFLSYKQFPCSVKQ